MLCNGKLIVLTTRNKALCVIVVITIAQWKEALIVIVFGWHFLEDLHEMCVHNITSIFSFLLLKFALIDPQSA
jgi:hypothetical protein